jgi:hypothetical protein
MEMNPSRWWVLLACLLRCTLLAWQSDVLKFLQVNFNHLHMNTLKRYKRHYKLGQDVTTKAELVEVSSLPRCLLALFSVS